MRAEETYDAVRVLMILGRMGQLGNIHVVNTKAYLDAGRYVMTRHGGYTDAEVDVLSEHDYRNRSVRELKAQLQHISKISGNTPYIPSPCCIRRFGGRLAHMSGIMPSQCARADDQIVQIVILAFCELHPVYDAQE